MPAWLARCTRRISVAVQAQCTLTTRRCFQRFNLHVPRKTTPDKEWGSRRRRGCDLISTTEILTFLIIPQGTPLFLARVACDTSVTHQFEVLDHYMRCATPAAHAPCRERYHEVTYSKAYKVARTYIPSKKLMTPSIFSFSKCSGHPTCKAANPTPTQSETPANTNLPHAVIIDCGAKMSWIPSAVQLLGGKSGGCWSTATSIEAAGKAKACGKTVDSVSVECACSWLAFCWCGAESHYERLWDLRVDAI